jgi:hypothetical protein
MRRSLLSMALVCLLASACGGRSEEPDERAPRDSGPEALVVAVDGELRLVAMDGRSLSLWKDEPFFSGLQTVDIIAQEGFLLVRAYAGAAGGTFRFALLGKMATHAALPSQTSSMIKGPTTGTMAGLKERTNMQLSPYFGSTSQPNPCAPM